MFHFLLCISISLVNAKLLHKKVHAEKYPLLDLQNAVSFEALSSLPTAEDHLITELPGLPEEFQTKQFAGHLPVSSDFEHGGHLFYWLFEAEESPNEKPLVIWLNGGPGCSSLEGLFQELGPFKVDYSNNGTSLVLNPNSWHKVANMVFIDQPVGTGLSFPGNNQSYAKSEADVDRDFSFFLQQFFKVHSNYVTEQTTRPVYFAGESYAGRYIPSIVDRILSETTGLSINIAGMAIGNGWTNPRIQYDYTPFAVATGLIGNEQAVVLREQYQLCLNRLNEGYTSGLECEAILDMIVNEASIPNGAQLNIYDVRMYLKDTSKWPKGIENIPLYLDQPNVRKALHAERSRFQWQECSSPVYNNLVHEDGITTAPSVEAILQRKVRTLFYNGQFDLICNHLGTQRFLHELQWYGLEDFVHANRSIWIVDGQPAGYIKSTTDQILTFLVFLGGSHMAPMNEPANALDMIRRFIQEDSFKDIESEYLVPLVITTSEDQSPKEISFGAIVAMVFVGSVIAVYAHRKLTRRHYYNAI